MTDQDEQDAATAKAVKQASHEAEHERLMHERTAAGSTAAAEVLGRTHPRTAAEVAAAAQKAIEGGADAAPTMSAAHLQVRELSAGRDLGVLASRAATRAAHHDVAAAQRKRGELTPGSRMAAERADAADAAYEQAIAAGRTEAQAQELADAASLAVSEQQDAAGGPLDQERA